MYVCSIVVIVVVVVLWEKFGQNCMFDKFSSGSHNNNRDNGLLGEPEPNQSNIDFVVNLKSKSPMGGDYFYFKICLDD